MKSCVISPPPRRSPRFFAWMLACVFWSVVTPLGSQTLSGVVTNACSDQPVADANVKVRVSANPPGSVPLTYVVPLYPDGSWNLSLSTDYEGPWYVTVSGGASQPASYTWYTSQGNVSNLNFDLLVERFDVLVNGQALPFNNGPGNPLELCVKEHNCIRVVAPEDVTLVDCYQLSLYGSDLSGIKKKFIARSKCVNFYDEGGSLSCPGSFDLYSLIGPKWANALPDVIYVELKHFCCREGCPPSEGALVNEQHFYIRLLDEVEVDFQFTAGTYIDQINAPPHDDGLVPRSEQLPGPELGAATIGLNIGEFSDDDNVLEWYYTVEEVNCNDGATVVTLYTSPIDDDGGPLPVNETFIDKYMGPPGQETQAYFVFGTGLGPVNYTLNKCYKVTLHTFTLCGSAEVYSYFRIKQFDESGNFCTWCAELPQEDEAMEVSPHLVLQPNPASDQVLIRLQDAPTGPWGWTLMGADGKVWRRGSFDDAESGYQYLMSTSDLPAGLYLLRVQTAEQALVRKLLVQH